MNSVHFVKKKMQLLHTHRYSVCVCVYWYVTFFFLSFFLIVLTGCQCRLEAEHISSQGSHMFSSEHGHVCHLGQAQLQGHQHAGPGSPHQLPHWRLATCLWPELCCVCGGQPFPWDARKCHYENLWHYFLLTFDPRRGCITTASGE